MGKSIQDMKAANVYLRVMDNTFRDSVRFWVQAAGRAVLLILECVVHESHQVVRVNFGGHGRESTSEGA